MPTDSAFLPHRTVPWWIRGIEEVAIRLMAGFFWVVMEAADCVRAIFQLAARPLRLFGHTAPRDS